MGDGVSITESNQSGVYLSGADATIHDADISDADTAIEVVNGSDVAITDSVIEYSYLGVYVMGSDTAALNQGGSFFNHISGYYITNFNSSETIYANGNCFDMSTTPSSKKFAGIGPIIYLPGSCQ